MLRSSVFITLKIKSRVGAGSQLSLGCPTHRLFVPPCLCLLSVQIGKNLGKDFINGEMLSLDFLLAPLSCLPLKY